MKTIAELNAIRDKMLKLSRDRHPADENTTKVVVGMGTCGLAAGAREVMNALYEAVSNLSLENVVISQSACMGNCGLEPMVEVSVPGMEKVTYVKVTPEIAAEIVEGHVVNHTPVVKYTENN